KSAMRKRVSRHSHWLFFLSLQRQMRRPISEQRQHDRSSQICMYTNLRVCCESIGKRGRSCFNEALLIRLTDQSLQIMPFGEVQRCHLPAAIKRRACDNFLEQVGRYMTRTRKRQQHAAGTEYLHSREVNILVSACGFIHLGSACRKFRRIENDDVELPLLFAI